MSSDLIFESECMGFSYGLRPRGQAHEALDAVVYVVECGQVNDIVDADLRSFFDEVDQAWLVRMLGIGSQTSGLFG